MANIGDLLVGGLLPVTTQALANRLQHSAAPGALSEFTVLNFDTTTGYLILLLDQVATPANGAVIPIDQFFVGPATSTVPGMLGVSYTPYPMGFKNGLWIVGSTTLTTPYTLATGTNSGLAISAKGQNG